MRGKRKSPPLRGNLKALPCEANLEDKGKAVNKQVYDNTVADLCQRLMTGDIKLQHCAPESIDVGTRDSPHVGDLPSLLGGHPSVGAHPSRNDHSESLNCNPIFNITAENPDASDSDEEPPELLSQSEDDSDFWEEFEDSDSEDEVIIVNPPDTVYNPIFNENEEGDGMDEDPFYEDEDYTVETNDYEEL